MININENISYTTIHFKDKPAFILIHFPTAVHQAAKIDIPFRHDKDINMFNSIHFNNIQPCMLISFKNKLAYILILFSTAVYQADKIDLPFWQKKEIVKIYTF